MKRKHGRVFGHCIARVIFQPPNPPLAYCPDPPLGTPPPTLRQYANLEQTAIIQLGKDNCNRIAASGHCNTNQLAVICGIKTAGSFVFCAKRAALSEQLTFGGLERRGGQAGWGRQLGSPCAPAPHVTAPCAAAMCRSTTVNTTSLSAVACVQLVSASVQPQFQFLKLMHFCIMCRCTQGEHYCRIVCKSYTYSGSFASSVAVC